MKKIDNVLDYKINKPKLKFVVGGDGDTGIDANGNATDVWVDTNGDGFFGEGDHICMLPLS